MAVQDVAPAEVNWNVWPTVTLATVGEIVKGATRVMVADAIPAGPEAVTVTREEDGMVAGAVYRPDELMVPAVADHEVAPADVNCCDAPSKTVALVGEIVCAPAKETVAEAEPPGPVAVTVIVPEDGMVAGAV